jgi:predicted P-loop ATPase/GTPase
MKVEVNVRERMMRMMITSMVYLKADKKEKRTNFLPQERRVVDQRKEDHNSRLLTCLYIHFNLILIKSINTPFHILFTMHDTQSAPLNFH